MFSTPYNKYETPTNMQNCICMGKLIPSVDKTAG
jgi:hypothetical protein